MELGVTSPMGSSREPMKNQFQWGKPIKNQFQQRNHHKDGGFSWLQGGEQKGVYQLKPIKIYIVEIPSFKGRFEFSDFFHKMGEVGIIRGLF